MLCENCGENEANVRYTQIINGVKKEMRLCEECAKEKGITNIDFNMPINFSSFLGNVFDDYYESAILPQIGQLEKNKCKKCGLTYDEFINTGKFGCENCYNTFSDKIEYLVKNLHGSTKHIGRKTKFIKENSSEIKNDNKKENKGKINEQETELEKLKKELKDAIKDERYEDAAKIRDDIKKLEE